VTPGNEWPVRWSSGSSKENKKREFGEAFLSFFPPLFFLVKKKREKKGAKGKRLDAPIYKTHYMSTWWNGHLPSLWGLWCAWLLAHRADTAESKKRNRFVLQAFLSFYLFLFLKVVRTTCPVCVQLVLLLLSFLFLDCRLRNATRYWKK
jgi:hypothetical protein